MRKNTAPFNWETRDEFAFREFESNLISRVSNIFKNEQGIFVLYGVRGTGKTSIKNYALSISKNSKYDNNKVFINIPFYTNDDDLYKHMLEQLLHNKNVENFREEVEEIFEVFEKEITSEDILRNDINETSAKKNILENRGELGGRFSFRGFNLSGGKLKSKSKEENKSESYAKQNIKRSLHIPTPQDKKKRFLELLKKIQREFKIIIIIDELDKLNSIEIGQFVESNKLLFIDTKITILLITDLIKGVYLKENLAEYVKDFLLCRSFSFYEYIVKAENVGNPTGHNFLEVLNDYYLSRGNNRELTYMSMRSNERNEKPLYEINYFLLQSTRFYVELPEEYQEVFRLFWGRLLENLRLLKRMKLHEYKEFVEEFIAKNDIGNVTFRLLFKRFEELVAKKELPIADYSFYSYFDNWEEIAKFFQKIVIECGILVGEEGCFLQAVDNDIDFRSNLQQFLQGFNINEEQFVQALKRSVGLVQRDYHVSSNLKMRILRNEDVSNGVYHAQRIIQQWRNEIIGVVIFYPFNKNEKGEWYEKPLRNGFIYRKNIYDEIICYPYVGYIGFHSHKPKELDKFIEFLKKEKVAFFEVPDIEEGFWDECFKKRRNDEQKDAILDLCERYGYVEKWLYEISL